ncbi:MAG: thermonuclease family protein [Patescibacteria group bacterium]
MIKENIKKVFNYVLIIVLALFSLIFFVEGKILSGLILLVVIFLSLPKYYNLIATKLNINIGRNIKRVVLISLFFISFIVVGATENSGNNKGSNQVNQNLLNTEELINNSNQETIESDDFLINNTVDSFNNNDNLNIANKDVNQEELIQNNAIPNDFKYYQVVEVVDGDTIKIDLDGSIESIRLIGMDTPETVDPRKPVQCFGEESSKKAKELLLNKKVRLEDDPTQYDKYGRLIKYVYLENGEMYNKKMIEDGYAHEYTYDIPYKYQSEFQEAEKYARENKLGLWSDDTCSGNTVQEAVVVKDEPISSTDKIEENQSLNKYYTSSYGTSKYYYPEDCDGWKSLSPKYLKSFNSLEELLKFYPSKTLSPQCY